MYFNFGIFLIKNRIKSFMKSLECRYMRDGTYRTLAVIIFNVSLSS